MAIQKIVTPKFLFGFFKRFYLTWGRWFKKKFKRTLPLKYFFFFMAKVLFGFTQDLSLVLEVLAFIWNQDKMLFIWGKWLLKISLKMHYGFWNNPLPLSTFLSCHGLSANTLSKPFPHLWIMIRIKSSKLNLPIWLFSI